MDNQANFEVSSVSKPHYRHSSVSNNFSGSSFMTADSIFMVPDETASVVNKQLSELVNISEPVKEIISSQNIDDTKLKKDSTQKSKRIQRKSRVVSSYNKKSFSNIKKYPPLPEEIDTYNPQDMDEIYEIETEEEKEAMMENDIKKIETYVKEEQDSVKVDHEPHTEVEPETTFQDKQEIGYKDKLETFSRKDLDDEIVTEQTKEDAINDSLVSVTKKEQIFSDEVITQEEGPLDKLLSIEKISLKKSISTIKSQIVIDEKEEIEKEEANERGDKQEIGSSKPESVKSGFNKGANRGLYRDPFRMFHYCKDYRDPEPPPLDDKTLRKIFFPKEMTEEICKGDASKEVLLSQTDLREQVKTVMKGTYKTVTSVTDAIRFRNHLLQNIPKRSPREMRRLTMPPSQSLLLELEEEGFVFSSKTLERFMDLDDELIVMYEKIEQSKLERKPLRQNKYYLIVLSEALKLVEVYNKYGRKKEIYSLYMYLGKFFEGLHSSWMWLTYELYNLAVDVVTGYKNDLGFGEAIVRYTLGKFCLDKLKDPEEALPHFQAAYNVSHGRNWTTQPLTNKKDEVIHNRSSYMMHVASLMIANEIINKNPKRATELGFSALKRIVETGIHPDIEDALRGLANLYQKAKRPETAIIVLNRQIQQSKDLKDYSGVINGYFLLAYCYRAMKKYDKAYESLKIMDELAVKHGEKRLQAMACKYLGEYHLSLDEYQNSEKYFSRAIKKYMEVDLVDEAYKCSVHAGAVKAALNMSTYVDLILGVSTAHDLHSLIEWQLSEDPVLWNKLTSSLRHKESADTKALKMERRTVSRSTQYQTLVPNHPRIRNSIYNLSDIHIVNSAVELD